MSSDTLVGYTCPAVKEQCQIMLTTTNFSKKTAGPSSAMSGSEDTCCPLSLWCLQCCCWAFCMVSWVCLQHHATVVISNGVTICGSKFPPTVSKHCQHQHSAITQTIPAMWNTDNPRCCDIQGAASSVQHHGSLCSQAQQFYLWCFSMPANINNHNITRYSAHSIWPFAADRIRTPHQNVQLPTYSSIL